MTQGESVRQGESRVRVVARVREEGTVEGIDAGSRGSCSTRTQGDGGFRHRMELVKEEIFRQRRMDKYSGCCITASSIQWMGDEGRWTGAWGTNVRVRGSS